MRLEQFYYLIEISKQPSLSQAAVKLHLTPQALSMSVSSLEKELGLTLLDRTYRGVRLTEDGHKVKNAARLFLDTLERLRLAREPVHPLLFGEYELLTYFGENNAFILELLTQMAQDMPDFALHVAPSSSKKIERQLLSGKSLLALASCCQINGRALGTLHPALTFIPLFTSRLLAQIPSGYPAAAYKTISLKTLLVYPIILYKNDRDKDPLLLKILQQFGSTEHVTAKSNPLCQSLVNAGLGIGIYVVPTFHRFMENSGNNETVLAAIRDDVQIVTGFLLSPKVKPSAATLYLMQYMEDFAESLQ